MNVVLGIVLTALLAVVGFFSGGLTGRAAARSQDMAGAATVVLWAFGGSVVGLVASALLLTRASRQTRLVALAVAFVLAATLVYLTLLGGVAGD